MLFVSQALSKNIKARDRKSFRSEFVCLQQILTKKQKEYNFIFDKLRQMYFKTES